MSARFWQQHNSVISNNPYRDRILQQTFFVTIITMHSAILAFNILVRCPLNFDGSIIWTSITSLLHNYYIHNCRCVCEEDQGRVGHRCTPPGFGGHCRTHGDCLDEEECIQGSCRGQCNQGVCPSEQFCSNGKQPTYGRVCSGMIQASLRLVSQFINPIRGDLA